MMRRATGRPMIIGFLGGYHGESTTTAALGAEHSEISRGLRGLVPGFVHVPYPNPYRSPFREPRPGGSGDATVDYMRDHVLFHARRPGRGRRRGDRADARLGWVHRAAAGVLDGARPSSAPSTAGCFAPTRSRPASDAPATCSRSSAGARARPDLPRQGARRRGDADRRGARRPSARLGGYRRPAHREHLVVAAGLLRRRARDPRLLRPRTGARERRASSRASPAPASTGSRRASTRSARCAPSAAFSRSSSSATGRRRSATTDLQDAVAAEACRRGVIADSSTTSLNLQPSLVMPPEVLERAFDLVEESIATVLA